ncbi:Bug family tripartite tricarboxylate transporter substrate binding protein [Muricoccus aerilatus]|uniref:Bug family tripartite tricarboxylate transporter substrate binding protein n=1 Tax=Muricoccus aerilatus TaxID=452982 RepID=UPI0005C24CBD|nr:tripartite tricarboxylate transporter substrate binding protein [Roseomonas aerilata]
MLRRRGLFQTAAGIAAGGWAVPARAQGGATGADWPNRPVRIVVPYAPGGANDILARLYSQKLSERLGQPFVVENRAGGQAIIGSEYVARSQADGYTLLLGATGTMIFNPVTYERLSYDPVRDFVPVSIAASFPLVLAVSGEAPFRTVQELVAHAKANPDGMTYGTSSAGFQMATELFNLRAGTRFTFVAYRGSAESVNAAAAREVTMTLVDVGPAAGALQAGRLRGLAVTSEERLPAFPDIPTMKELGFPDLSIVLWSGLMAPAGTPEPIVRRLNEEIVRANAAPDLRERLRALSVDPVGSSTEEARRAVTEGITFWRGIVRQAGLRFER